LPPKDFFLSIGEEKSASFAIINATAWRDVAVLLVGLLGSFCAAWAGRNLVFGPTQGFGRPVAQLCQSTRQNAFAVMKRSAPAVIAPAHEVSWIVESLTNGRFVSLIRRVEATYFARGPPG
jgi:hypothetical protein